jgi:hypothetical protein
MGNGKLGTAATILRDIRIILCVSYVKPIQEKSIMSEIL